VREPKRLQSVFVKITFKNTRSRNVMDVFTDGSHRHSSNFAFVYSGCCLLSLDPRTEFHCRLFPDQFRPSRFLRELFLRTSKKLPPHFCLFWRLFLGKSDHFLGRSWSFQLEFVCRWASLKVCWRTRVRLNRRQEVRLLLLDNNCVLRNGIAPDQQSKGRKFTSSFHSTKTLKKLTSQICNFICFPPTLTILESNSTPIVWLESSLTANESKN
jgi:hypothetical protein